MAGFDEAIEQYSVYGWRAKLGVIVPPTNTVNEAEWNRMAPEGVTIHSTRMPLHEDTTSEAGKKALHADIDRASKDLAQAGVDVVAYACTAGSMIHPVEALSEYMTAQCGVGSVTTAGALLLALRSLKVKKIAVATPYHDALNAHERAFLTEAGFEVLSIKGLGIGQNGPAEYRQIARVPPQVVYRHVKSADHPEAEAMLVSCTDFATLEMLPVLESELGKPVITSNQATFWSAIRKAGLRDRFDRYGSLLKDH